MAKRERELPAGFGDEVHDLVNRIKPLLAEHGPLVQGAALADLLSIWFASHFVDDDVAETRKLRSHLMKAHNRVMPELVAVSARELGLPE